MGGGRSGGGGGGAAWLILSLPFAADGMRVVRTGFRTALAAGAAAAAAAHFGHFKRRVESRVFCIQCLVICRGTGPLSDTPAQFSPMHNALCAMKQAAQPRERERESVECPESLEDGSVGVSTGT